LLWTSDPILEKNTKIREETVNILLFIVSEFADNCNEKKLSMTKIFYDTTIPYHQTIIIAIASI